MGHRGGVRAGKRAAAVAVAAAAAGVLLGYWSGAGPGVLAALAGLIPAVIWHTQSDPAGRQRHRP
jgi:hypothetical protein